MDLPTQSQQMSGAQRHANPVHIKSEPEEINDQQSSDIQLLLYADHDIKDELVVGPTEVQLPLRREEEVLRRRLDASKLLSCRVELQDIRHQLWCAGCHYWADSVPDMILHKTRCISSDNHMLADYENHDYTRFCCLDNEAEETKPCLNKIIAENVPHKSDVKNEPGYECDFCAQIFETKKLISQHIGIHLKNNLKSLKKCEKSTHYMCKICNKGFVLKSNFIKHKDLHLKVRCQYTCDVCNKTFTAKCSLNIHKNIHTGTKPYSCEICDSRFTQKNDLIRHETVHTGEKRYLCDICCKPFARSNDLSRHKNLHTAKNIFICDICGKTYYRKYHLIDHMLIHLKTKRYSCENCKKQFITNYCLKRHKQTTICKKNAVRIKYV